MKKLVFSTLVLICLLLANCSQKNEIVFSSSHLQLSLDLKGNVTFLGDPQSKINYHFADTLSPILSVWKGDQILMPTKAIFNKEKGVLAIDYPLNIEAKIKVEQKESHITLELLSISENDGIDLVLWGPYPTTINGTIGETVGVVRNDNYAIGLQALNPKTLGGYPWNDNDAMPQIDIFEGDDFSDLSEQGKRYVLYRVEAAKPTDFGSTLQAYTRNRTKDRIIENWGKEQYLAPAYNDGGVVGSKIAIFGSPEKSALETIGKIEVAEGLPHPMIDGEWGKTVRSASAAYLIMGFSEDNIDRAIDYTKKAGLRYLYHDGPFENWGHFALNPTSFPNGWSGMKLIVEKAEANGLHVGVHTLSNFITTNDPYVTPIPDDRLAKVGSSVLSENIDDNQKEIPVASPDFFRQFQNNSLKTIQLGSELVRYAAVSEEAPWKLLDCQRGAFNTKPAAHKQDEKVSLLADHGYKVFLTDPALTKEMATNLADFYNQTGLRQISFDGLEGNRSTAMGNYGEVLFTNTWYEQISDDIRSHYIADASRTSHYFWHMYTRMNWGEPWYAGFRESQTEYRLKNQKYFQRNYMPGMLGWFSLRPTSSIEDIEWMLARSAAFNAGYAFVTSFESLQKNGNTDAILSAIGEWEKARMADVFSVNQKSRMEDIKNEFHLETVNDEQWELHQVYSYKFKHERKIRQPGEPLYSTFEFENTTGTNNLQFILTAVDSDLSNITLELDNYKKVRLPISIESGQTLKYNGGTTAILYSENWQKISEVSIDQSVFSINDGSHNINLDCSFSKEGKEPLAKLEVRIYGSAESVSK